MQLKKTPYTLQTALLALAASPVITAFGMVHDQVQTSHALLYLAASCLAIGFGETVNHPPQCERNYSDNETSALRRLQHRSRNPCLLGNLLVIAGILFLFISVSQVISF